MIVGFRQPDVALPATIGPWRTRPASAPAGYRLVKSGRRNAVGRGGWLAILTTAASPGATSPAPAPCPASAVHEPGRAGGLAVHHDQPSGVAHRRHAMAPPAVDREAPRDPAGRAHDGHGAWGPQGAEGHGS